MSFYEAIKGERVIVTVRPDGDGWRYYHEGSGPEPEELIPPPSVQAQLDGFAKSGAKRIQIDRRGTGISRAYQCTALEDGEGPSRETSADLFTVGQEIKLKLIEIESLLGPSFKLTLIARNVQKDIGDADIVITSDGLTAVLEAIQKRIKAGDDGDPLPGMVIR